jgi:hypothetical protein
MVVKAAGIRLLVVLAAILSLTAVMPASAQDEPCGINPNAWGITIDSVQITDQAGYTTSSWHGWDPSLTVTEFGSWEPILMTVNYTITDEDSLPCRVKAIFKAFGEKQVIKERRSKTGSYSVTATLFSAGASPGTYNIRCVLKVKNRDGLVGWGKTECTVSIVD